MSEIIKCACGSSAAPEFPVYKTASINCDPVLFRKEENITHQLALVEEAARNGAKLIALPEMATTGYCWYDRSEVAPYVEPVPGPTTDRFGEITKKYGCYIVVGMPEVDKTTGLYYNSAVLIGPDGVIGCHRKTHSYISEPKWTKQGDLDHQVFATPIGNIGILICMDIHFIETARLEALRGADVIVHVSNWLAEKTPAPYWITRAFDNGCYVLESNRCGLERTVQFSGGSCLINPDGTIQSYADHNDEICYGTVDISAVRSRKLPDGTDKMEIRRPELYMDICSDPYLWNPLDFFRLYGYDPLPEGTKSKVTAAQMDPVYGIKQSNLAKISELTDRAHAAGSELIVFPELCCTGTPSDIAAASALAETADGDTVHKLIDLSMKYHMYICAGFVETDGEKLYNSAALTGPEGLVMVYRKLHLNASDKRWNACAGEDFSHANIPLGRVGIMIGSDAMVPECGRMLALRGVDIILCPSSASFPEPYGLAATTAWHNYPIPRGMSTIHWHLWRVRAGENNCYTVFANRTDSCFGRSGVFGPDTFKFPRDEVILPASGEELGTMEIDTSNLKDSVYPTNVVRRKDLVCMRQPLWYDLLIDPQPPVLGIK